MIDFITDVSKYIFIILIVTYTYFNFRYFGVKSIEKKQKLCSKQNVCMFLIHILAYAVLYLNKSDIRILIFYIMQLIFFAAYICIYRLIYRNVSRLLLNNMCMLLCTGFIILTRLSIDKAFRQFIIVAVSALITWIIPYIIDRMWQLSRLLWIYAIFGIICLSAVLISGQTSFGAQLSLKLGNIIFQPSELVKTTFVFFIASMFHKSTDFKQVFLVTLTAAIHVVILVLSKDLGGALIFFATYIFMLYAATGNIFYFLSGIAGGCAASVMSYALFAHVRVRVFAWTDPWSDIDNKGYQITQSLFAIGTGGMFGMGLCHGMPYKIPVVEKDFIFSAISEELGALFAICTALICLGCFIQFAMVACSMKAMFFKLLAFGLGVEYIMQVFLTIGGVIKFIPSTGVTLPLISYGGSSVFSTFIVFSIIQGLYILKRNQSDEDEISDYDDNGEIYDE